jgi:hypothetical protein
MANSPVLLHRNTSRSLPVAVLCCAVFSIPALAAEEPIRSANGISYVSGGVGDGSIERLRAISGKFNLKLVFALNSGNYLSGVEVSIMDSTGGKTLLAVTTDGPWLLVNLPKGRYRLVATVGDTPIKRDLVIGGAPLQTVNFRWARE